MGAWGFEPFEDDDALDWVAELERDGADAVKSAFDSTVDQDYLELPQGSIAVAAAEIVVSSFGPSTSTLPDSARAAVDRFASEIIAIPQIKELARTALDRVMAPNSELYELWSETPDFEAWKRTVTQIRDRLEAT